MTYYLWVSSEGFDFQSTDTCGARVKRPAVIQGVTSYEYWDNVQNKWVATSAGLPLVPLIPERVASANPEMWSGLFTLTGVNEKVIAYDAIHSRHGLLGSFLAVKLTPPIPRGMAMYFD